MSTKELTISTVVHDHRTATEWAATTTPIRKGAICIEMDTYRVKVGDGVNLWRDLPYIDDTNMCVVDGRQNVPANLKEGALIIDIS